MSHLAIQTRELEVSRTQAKLDVVIHVCKPVTVTWAPETGDPQAYADPLASCLWWQITDPVSNKVENEA